MTEDCKQRERESNTTPLGHREAEGAVGCEAAPQSQAPDLTGMQKYIVAIPYDTHTLGLCPLSERNSEVETSR